MKWSKAAAELYYQDKGQWPTGYKAPKEYDPSAARLDSLAVSEENLVQGKASKTDSLRLKLAGRLKEDKPKEQSYSKALSEYKAKRTIDILGGDTATEQDSMLLPTFLKPEKEGKVAAPVSPESKQLEYVKALRELNKLKDEQAVDEDGKAAPLFDEGSTGRGAILDNMSSYADSLGMAKRAKEFGISDFPKAAKVFGELEASLDDVIMIRDKQGLDAAAKYLKEQTGMELDEAQELIDVMGGPGYFQSRVEALRGKNAAK